MREFLTQAMSANMGEMDCRAVLVVIDRYVELRASHANEDRAYPGVLRHLAGCPPCAEMVRTLELMVRLEEQGRLPDLDHLWDDLRRATRGGFLSRGSADERPDPSASPHRAAPGHQTDGAGAPLPA